jgi:hypothetical protein
VFNIDVRSASAGVFNIVVVLTLAVVMTTSAAAQVTAGGVRGVVTDPAGAVVPGVAIKIANIETGFEASGETGGSGNYVMVNIPVGPYRLEATLDGFKTFVAENVQVLTATTATVNIIMEIGELVEQITVSETICPSWWWRPPRSAPAWKSESSWIFLFRWAVAAARSRTSSS